MVFFRLISMNQFITDILSMPRWFPGLIIVLSCASCFPIPVPITAFNKPPYPPEILQKLSQQGSNRILVRQTLGSPKAIKSNGQYWFYANVRESLGLIGTDVVFVDAEWVTVQFDEVDHVVFLEHNDDHKGCLSNGICQYAGLFSTQPSKAVITAPSVQDIPAKSYPVRADECAVYVFLESHPFLSMGSVMLSIDGRARSIIDEKTYWFQTHPAGEVSISAYQFDIITKCKGGARLYVRAVKALDWSWETGEDLAPVDASEGEAAIRARRLALPN